MKSFKIYFKILSLPLLFVILFSTQNSLATEQEIEIHNTGFKDKLFGVFNKDEEKEQIWEERENLAVDQLHNRENPKNTIKKKEERNNEKKIIAKKESVDGSLNLVTKKRIITQEEAKDTEIKESSQEEAPTIADVVEQLLPTVVNISTVQTAPYFNVENEEHYDEAIEGVKSLGSGFIVNPEGYIVTNNHVVEGASEITVILNDKSKYKAEIVGSDKRSDMALLKIDTKRSLPSVKFGNSEDIRIGEQIVVVGNPFNLGSSVSTGIISAKGRNISYGPFSGLLQTDAAINQGNSGGPMFNMNGEVIGISSAIYSPSGGSVGVGFAIPSNTAIPIIEELEKYGYITRGWLGVGVREIDKSMIEALGLRQDYGVIITRIVNGSPASKAELQISDVIVKFADREVRNINDLMQYVANTEINSGVTIRFFRKGKEMKANVKIAELREQTTYYTDEEEDLLSILLSQSVNVSGMSVIGLTDELKSKLYIDPAEAGLLVIAVERGTEASNKGVKSRDIIQSVNQKSVFSAEDFVEELETAKSDDKNNILLMLKRDDFIFPMTLKIK